MNYSGPTEMTPFALAALAVVPIGLGYVELLGPRPDYNFIKCCGVVSVIISAVTVVYIITKG